VGVESDEELLCIQIRGGPDEARINSDLTAQLPDGCELLSVNVARAESSFQPCSATYVLPARQEYLNEKLQSTTERLLASENLYVRRRVDAKGSRVKNVDVRGFLKSIKLGRRGIIVECRIDPVGSIRVDEILGLLELDESKLSGPIRRTNVQWRSQ
jgi:hypothetical protein